MPRPRKETVAEPKKRSRTGCWPCKARKVKCGEEKPSCTNCVKSGETCDYSIRLNWAGRSRKEKDGMPGDLGTFTFVSTPAPGDGSAQAERTASPIPGSAHGHGHGHDHVFSAQHISTGPSRPSSTRPADLPTPEPTPGSEAGLLDPRLRLHEFKPQLSTTHHLQPNAQRSPRSPPTSAPVAGDEFSWSPQHGSKRVKLDHSQSPPTAQPSPVFAVPHYPPQFDNSPASTPFTQHSISSIVNTPATPGSTVTAGSPYPPPAPSLAVHQPQDPPDLRRLSVKSLLSEPSEEVPRPPVSRNDSQGYRTYGYDHGFPDLDIPHNDDSNVILPKSPDLRRPSAAVSELSTSSNEPDARQIAFEPGGYYAQPVPIKLPRNLEPLPDELLNNQMNLLYFHHFINHTGRILAPHDCHDNPLRSVLPQMAVGNKHLLHLMLTFSASHRARLLDHPEPANRIAAWMTDVLPTLRQAIAQPASPGAADPRDPSSLAPLATAIMLASLDIISPHTFAISIPWQSHLKVAREIIINKGGLDYLAQKAGGARDKAIFFLSRWFAYLDVLGSFSGGQQELPLYGAYFEDGGGLWLVNRDPGEIYEIDCFFGFSGRCISLLAQVAELALQCDSARIDPITQQVRPEWQPSSETRAQAEDLQRRLLASARTVYDPCSHSATTPAAASSIKSGHTHNDEIFATNEAFHWAGLLHLSRRVLNLPRSHADVQENVHRILHALKSVRRGSSAESCLLFPMFVAGCEAFDEAERQVLGSRMREVAGWGMANFESARTLMERVWSTGRPWETMVRGEFLG